MWHEARKQEKKIRCMLVDYQRRAQRRKDYYDKIKADPTQFLQLHGRQCKIHLDPAVCIAANSSATMMPWQGNTDIMIDRFDVRAHLDYISDIQTNNKVHNDLSYEERQINYERYRILVQNDFFNVTEDKFLHQINLEEKFGPVLKNAEQETTKKRQTVAIGYNYDDGNDYSGPTKTDDHSKKDFAASLVNTEENNDDDSESDIDLDLTVDVSKIETQQANELNSCAHPYGMITNDFFSFLNNDLEEAENMRIVKEQEEEKAMFSGRKSRKERRAYRERTLVGRKLSPPSYAWRKSPSYDDYKALVSSNRSRSKSVSPVNSGKITYITSFGGDEPTPSAGSTSSRPSTSASLNTQKDSSKRRNRSRSRSKDVDNRNKRFIRSRSSSEDRRRISGHSKLSRSRSRSRSRNASRSRKRDDSYNDKSYRKHTSRSRSHSPLRRASPRMSPRIPVDSTTASGSGVNFSNVSASESTVIPRYYGRRKEASSSELSLSSDDESNKQTKSTQSKVNPAIGPSRMNASIKGNTGESKLTPQERLKRKRQVLLNKQFKADKRAEREKVLKMVQERLDRAEEMKEISIKLRRRQRMLRHNDSPSRRNSRSTSRSRSSSEKRSSSRSPFNKHSYKRRDKHRDRSYSSDDRSDDSYRNNRRTTSRRRCRGNSSSRSRSRSRSSSRNSNTSRSRSRSSSRRGGRYSDDNSRVFRNIKESDKGPRSRRYCTLSEERELARVQLENKNEYGPSSDRRNDYRSKRDTRSPPRDSRYDEGSNEKRDRSYRDDRSKYSSRRSSSYDRRFSRYD